MHGLKKRIGEKANGWKGDKVGYNGLHMWIRKYWKKPKNCQKCGINKKLDWANISGRYTRSNKNDWLALCLSCHRKMDMTDEWKKNISKSKKKEKHPLWGKHHTLKTKQKMSRAKKGKLNSKEHNQKISQNNAKFWLGKKFSQEHREKISQKKKGKKNSIKHNQNISLGMKHTKIIKN